MFCEENPFSSLRGFISPGFLGNASLAQKSMPTRSKCSSLFYDLQLQKVLMCKRMSTKGLKETSQEVTVVVTL